MKFRQVAAPFMRSLTRSLIRVLLIAVFLNAAVGMPLHAAVHLASSEAPHFTSAPDDDDGGERAHSTCAWCVAHAEASGGPPAAPELPPTRGVQLSHAGLWSSSPRGPPR